MSEISDSTLWLIILVGGTIAAFMNKSMWTESKVGYIFVVTMVGLLSPFVAFPYVIMYEGKHGKYTSFFKSKKTIKKEYNEKSKKIDSENISCVVPEKSISWSYLYDYDTNIQKKAIKKLSHCKENNKVNNKLLEIFRDPYQDKDVRAEALCQVQSSLHFRDKYDFKYLLWHSEWKLDDCLKNKTISGSTYLIQDGTIEVYERSEGEKADSLIQRVLRYDDDTRKSYADYLINHKSDLSRIFEDGLIDWFTNEDLVKKIKALSDNRLIYGDPNVEKALLEVLKIPDEDIIHSVGNTLGHAYKWNNKAQEILASHLEPDNNVGHAALFVLHFFRPYNTKFVVSNVIKMLNDSDAYFREKAIDILKPYVISHYYQAKTAYIKNEEDKLVLKAFNRIKDMSKYDLDKDVKEKAKKALPNINYSKFMKPLSDVCKQNGGKIEKNECIVDGYFSNKVAKKICKESNLRLPRLEELTKELVDCGVRLGDSNKGRESFSYQSCYQDKGFVSSGEYISSTSNLYGKIADGKLEDNNWGISIKDAGTLYGEGEWNVICVQ